MNRNFIISIVFVVFSYTITAMENNPSLNCSAKLPIFYHPNYNIGFFGIEKIHPFPAGKYVQVHTHLKNNFNLSNNQFHTPQEATTEQLQIAHGTDYLNSMKNSHTVIEALLASLPIAHYVPNFILQHAILKPMRLATNGTVQAAQLALDPENPYKMAINLAGGYHHAQKDKGSGFCIYNDIAIACKTVWQTHPDAKILYVDLDAHQGDGVELIFKNEMQNTENKKFTVFDMYGQDNYPVGQSESKGVREFISYNFPFNVGNSFPPVDDNMYLKTLRDNLPNIIAATKPDLIFYNAGTDPYQNDALGRMKVSKQGLIERDEFVFTQAQENNIPIVMTLSGGYPRNKAESGTIIGESIANILRKIYNIAPVERTYAQCMLNYLKAWSTTDTLALGAIFLGSYYFYNKQIQ